MGADAIACHEEPYVKVLLEYLTSADFVQNMTLFTNSHASVFRELQMVRRSAGGVGNGAEESKAEFYAHGQYKVFVEFQEWADEMIAIALKDLNVDDIEFAQMLEESLHSHSSPPQVRELVLSLLDVIDSLNSFENFARLMQAAWERVQQAEFEEMAVLQTQLDMKEWDLQVALATSLVEGLAQAMLSDSDQNMIPWARSVLALDALLQRVGAPGQDPLKEEQDIERLSHQLVYDRLKVEYLVARRLKDDSDRLEQSLLEQYGSRSGSVANASASQQLNSGENSTLAKLLDDSGKIQLAINQHRDLLRRDDSMLCDSDYEQVYFAVRDELHKKSPKNRRGGAVFGASAGGRSSLKELQSTLGQRFSAIKYDPRILGNIAVLVWLEDRLRMVHRDIQNELAKTGSVKYRPVVIPSMGRQNRATSSSTGRGMSESSSNVVPEGSRAQSPGVSVVVEPPHLYVSTSNPGRDHEETLEKTGQFLDNNDATIASSRRTPKETVQVVQDLHRNLRLVTQEREVHHMKLRMEAEALEVACPRTSAAQAEMNQLPLRSAHKLASKAAQLEAMTCAENGHGLTLEPAGGDETLPLANGFYVDENHDDDEQTFYDDEENTMTGESEYEKYMSDGDSTEGEEETLHSDNYDSDATLAEQQESITSKGTGLRIKANLEPTTGDLLREAERLRKQLLLRGVSSSSSGSGRIQLSSPTPKSSNSGTDSGGSTPQSVRGNVKLSATSLRFLALSSMRGNPMKKQNS